MKKEESRMLSCFRIVSIVALIMITVGAAGPVSAQDPRADRNVSAQAECYHSSGAAGSTVSVDIDNEYGRPIVVLYVHGFTSGEAFNPEFAMEEPDPTLDIVIDDGESEQLSGGWDVFGIEGREMGAVLVVTSAGVLIPVCGGGSASLVNEPGGLPDSESDELLESVDAFVDTYGRLFSWHAYPALYALLHPDVQERVNFYQFACWSVEHFGTAAEWKDVIFDTTVTDVALEDWEWRGGEIEYDDAAEVSYEQKVGSLVETRVEESVMHLVEVDGAWRWFFGSSPQSIEELPDRCTF
jgi:hypothetical protein